MSYIFRLHKGDPIEQTGDGWLESKSIGTKEINEIEDSIDKMANVGKVGTSIPTPLARVYLFKTAFDMVGRTEGGKASGVYAELVSDCLDLLQFLFENGGDNQISFVTWDKNEELKKLKDSKLKTHMLLADALNTAFETAKHFPEKMVLIKYGNLVLGGISPYTLVYTSPNLRRELKNQSVNFTSNKNIAFCQGEPRSLSERPAEFQKYLYGMYRKYATLFTSEKPLYTFGNYVTAQLDASLVNNSAEISAQYDSNHRAYSELSVEGISICYNIKAPDMTSSHFLMKPSSEVEYLKKNNIPTPLFLMSKFPGGWTYIDDEWNGNTEWSGSLIQSIPITERQLPKNGSANGETMPQKYPWLTDSDFLYDQILSTRYKTNTDKFFNPIQGADFLLPIRKEYFLYFTLDDLKKNLRIEVDKSGDGVKRIRVELDIPLNSVKEKLTISRVYHSAKLDPNSKYKFYEEENTFGVGVFPFYQLPEPLKDQYNIYLYSQKELPTTLSFYSRKLIGDSGFVEVSANSVKRTELSASMSQVYSLRSKDVSKSFDYIEVSMKVDNITCEGLVVPLWPERIDVNNPDRKAIFSIDFGTSNTHIAYLDPSSESDNVKALPFSIEKEYQQMVLLNQPYKENDNCPIKWRDKNGFPGIPGMRGFLREFVPSVIGEDDRETGISYPIRTATFESENLNGCKKIDGAKQEDGLNYLFEGMNIGFNIDSENIKVEKGRYETNLKWAMQNGTDRAETRVKVFCEQTLWMLKNMLVLKNMYHKGIRIIHFYPESMMERDRDIFAGAWDDAAQRVFTDCGFDVTIEKPELESIAPFYSLIKQDGGLTTYNSVNVDIGGGTTDYFIFDRQYTNEETGERYYGYEASVQFAGDQLWGKKDTEERSTQNGFVEYQKSKVQSQCESGELKTLYDNFSGKDNPAALSSFFFKNIGFKFGENIRKEPKLQFVLFLHYASIIYYLADMIKEIQERRPDFIIPARLTFTGKGSEYIKLISKDDATIRGITLNLLHAFGLQKDQFKNGFGVKFPTNPKGLTAEGGIYKLTGDSTIQVRFKREDEESGVAVLGESDKRRNTSKYTNLGSRLLGFEPEEGKVYKSSEVRKNKDAVMNKVSDFVNNIYSSKGLSAELKKIGINLDEKNDKDKILKYAKESFEICAEKYERLHSEGDQILDETLFFLAWRNALIDLSCEKNKEISQK